MSSSVAGPGDAGVAEAAAPAKTAHPRATLAACILGSSLAFIDGSVVNVALPTLARDFGASPAEMSWTINAYLLPLGALILLGGGAGDKFGRRRSFLLGLALFLVASVLCALAPTLHVLLLGRALQGTGAAILMPNSLAILGASFTGEERGRAVGTWAASGALAGALGPLLGGWLVDTVGWRSIFFLNVPLGAGAAYLARRYVRESRQRDRSGLDWAGAGLATAALALLTWSLTNASEAHGASSLGYACASVLLLGAFVWVEHRRGDHALMPLAMFSTSSFVGLTLLTFFLYGSLGGLLVLLPFLLIRVAHYAGLAAGAALLPLPLLIGFGSRIMGRLTARVGGRLPLGIGASLVAGGLLLYARIDLDHLAYVPYVLPPTLLVGLGMAVSVAPLTASVMASVDAEHVGAASGFNSAAARIAGLVATALLGFVFAQQDSAAGFVAGFRVAVRIGAASAAVAAGCAFVLIRKST